MKHKRMGMARIEAHGHSHISHPYLHSSSTLVSSSPPCSRHPTLLNHNNNAPSSPLRGLTPTSTLTSDVFFESSSFHASARPRPQPPTFNAEALNALAARSASKRNKKKNIKVLSPVPLRSPTAQRRLKKRRSFNVNNNSADVNMTDSTTNMNMNADMTLDRDMSMSPPAAGASASRLPKLSTLNSSRTANDIDFFAPSPPSKPCTPAHRIRAPFRRVASPASSYGSPSPLRRRSASAFNSTPSASPHQYKTSGEASVDRALGGMLHSLRVAAHHATPTNKQGREYSRPLVSRWSSSEDEKDRNDKTSSTGHSWLSRKSNESSRGNGKHANSGSGSIGNAAAALTTILSRRSSRKAPSVKSLKSAKSTASIRSIKSGKSGRGEWGNSSMDMDVDVPPLPAMPASTTSATTITTTITATNTNTNTTPSRGRRMVEGLLKRLTPRKNKHDNSDASSSKNNSATNNTKHTPTRPGLTRSRTAPSLSNVAAEPAVPVPMPPPPVPPIPSRLPSTTSHATIKSVISRKMSSTTLRLGKSPRSTAASPNPPRSGSAGSTKSTATGTSSAAASSNNTHSHNRRPPLPTFDSEKFANLPKTAPSTPRLKNRRATSVHLPPPLQFATVSSGGPSTPPRTSTPSTPRAGTPAGSRTASTPNTPRSPSSSSPIHMTSLVRSLSRGSPRPSADLLQADMHGMEGCVPRPQRSRSPMSFAFARQRSTMSMSLSSASSVSSALHIPALAASTSPGPVLMPRASYFEPQSPVSPFPLFAPTSPSPSRSGTASTRSRRTVRNVKSTIGLPTLVSTTSEMAFMALTGRPASMVPPWAAEHNADKMEVVTDTDGNNDKQALPVSKPARSVVPPIAIIPVEPDVFEAEAPLATATTSASASASSTKSKVPSLNVPFPDSASLISSADSCDDAAEVITFATPQRARRATATTIFSLNAVKALASSSPPASPPNSPTGQQSLSLEGGSPKASSVLRTLEKLEARQSRVDAKANVNVNVLHARTDSTGTTGTAGTAHTPADTPALCRSASDAPSASPSESDGIATPPMISAQFEPLPVVQHMYSPSPSPSPSPKPTPLAVPLAPADGTRTSAAALATFSADLSALPLPHVTGTLTGKAARAAALAAATDPLKPRRLLQLLPRQQSRLALHRRKGVFGMEVEVVKEKEKEVVEVEVEVEVGTEETQARADAEVDGESQVEEAEAVPAPALIVDLSEDILMAPPCTAPIDPEIGLPIPPASPRTREPALPTLPAHLDRSRMRADSTASRPDDAPVPRRWPAWPPEWDSGAQTGRARAGTATSVATFGPTEEHTVEPTPTTPPAPAPAVEMLKKKGHAASASVNTFGGSHCSGASIANLEEFGVVTAQQGRKYSENSLADLNSPQVEFVDDAAGAAGAALDLGLDFSRRPRAGTMSGWSMGMGVGMDVDGPEEYVVTA